MQSDLSTLADMADDPQNDRSADKASRMDWSRPAPQPPHVEVLRSV